MKKVIFTISLSFILFSCATQSEDYVCKTDGGTSTITNADGSQSVITTPPSTKDCIDCEDTDVKNLEADGYDCTVK